MNPVKIAVYGPTGLIGKRHLKHILENPDAQVVALVDPSPSAAELAAITNNAPLYASDSDMLKDVASGKLSVDVGLISSPTHLHPPQCLGLIQHGIHVFVEKPFSPDSQSGQEVLQAAQKAGVKLIVGHHRRHNTYVRELKRLVDKNTLGRLVGFQGIWALKKPLSYFQDPWRTQVGSGGVILTNLIHEIDSLGYIFGPIIRVYCESGLNTRGFKVDETVSMTFKFANGAVGTFLMSDATAAPFSWEQATGENPNIPREQESCYTVLGTKGSIQVPQMVRFHFDEVEEDKANWNTKMSRDSSVADNLDDKPPLAAQLENVIAVLRDQAEPVCSGQDGLNAVRVVEAVQQSIRTGQPVNIPEA